MITPHLIYQTPLGVLKSLQTFLELAYFIYFSQPNIGIRLKGDMEIDLLVNA